MMRKGGPRPRRRIRRRLGLERNELRRPIDRVQRLIALGLLLLLALIATPAAIWAAGRAYDSGVAAERTERAERQEVVATVVSTAGADTARDAYAHETLKATWPIPGTGSDGQRPRTRTGTLPIWQNAEVGQLKTIWVDRAGEPAPRPRPHSRTVTDAAYAAGTATLASAAPVLLVYLLVRRRCDHYRLDMWEAAWARMDAERGRNRPS